MLNPDSHKNKINQVCLPLVRASVAWRRGRNRECVEQLLAVRYQIQRIGGSIAQRDLWNLLLIRSAIDSANSSSSSSSSSSSASAPAATPTATVTRHETPEGGPCFYKTLAEQLCHERCFCFSVKSGAQGGIRVEDGVGTEGERTGREGSELASRLLAEAKKACNT